MSKLYDLFFSLPPALFIDFGGPLSGKNVVMEDLRQICIYKNEPEKWWDYMALFEECYNKTLSRTLGSLKNCSEEKQALAKIDQEKVNKCVTSSFLDSDIDLAENTILSSERKKFYDEGIQLWPSVRISNMSFRVKPRFLFKYFLSFFSEYK